MVNIMIDRNMHKKGGDAVTSSEEQIRAALFSLRDETYAEFQSRLMPTVARKRVIGVRMPALRAYAKKISGSTEARDFLSALPHVYYDENNLHGALLDHIRDFDTALEEVERFLPYVDNWATCDLFCPKILLTHSDRLLERILCWLASEHPYTVRYGLVRLLTWYLDEPRFSSEVLNAAANITLSDYYVQMAQAWLFSIALVKQYDHTLAYFTENRLSSWVHNKALQKAAESYRVEADTKSYLKTLKRK